MAVADWSTDPDQNYEKPGIYVFDSPPTPLALPRSVRQIMADIAAAGWSDAYLITTTYGVTGNGVTDDTTNFQAALDAAASTGKPLIVPAGTYLTSGLTFPAGRVFVFMHPKAEIRPTTTNVTLLTFAADASRTNQKFLSGGVFNGLGLSGTVGMAFGGTTTALLYTRVQDSFITRCAEGFVGRNVQEFSMENVVCYNNIVGGVIESSPTDGGGTVLHFTGVRFQDNSSVGFVGISSSTFPIGGWLFDQCTFQSNLITGLALFGETGGNARLLNIQLLNCHFEGNGSSGTATATVRSKTVKRAGSYVVGSELTLDNCEAGESITAVTSQLLETAANVQLRNCVLGGGAKTQASADATSTVSFAGNTRITGTSTGIVDWSGALYKSGNGSGGVLQGFPLVTSGALGRNLYWDATGLPDTPEAGGIITATASKVFDAEQGWVQQVAYAASVGSFGANRVAFSCFQSAIASGDAYAVSILVYSAAAAAITFSVAGSATLLTAAVTLNPGWQRVVLYSVASTASTTTELVVWATTSAAPTVRFAKIMVDLVASGGDFAPITNMIRLGLYDNKRPVLTASAIPASGTFARGTRIFNSAPAVGSARGWTKVTTGAANVLGTDWINEGNL